MLVICLQRQRHHIILLLCTATFYSHFEYVKSNTNDSLGRARTSVILSPGGSSMHTAVLVVVPHLATFRSVTTQTFLVENSCQGRTLPPPDFSNQDRKTAPLLKRSHRQEPLTSPCSWMPSSRNTWPLRTTACFCATPCPAKVSCSAYYQLEALSLTFFSRATTHNIIGYYRSLK